MVLAAASKREGLPLNHEGTFYQERRRDEEELISHGRGRIFKASPMETFMKSPTRFSFEDMSVWNSPVFVKSEKQESE
ncbi:hypothetical protein KSF_005890 [Reticulibacter mediterranei]|uniref:Uncharacterized protein n=1 Tax=Reticulibacter mediterranei TaxID=2778369 RepID=A0A8J3IHW4_9CHLR|nr:hypothetical protein KSF_005890 [Reticulibacter mediterranei]